MLKTSLPNYWTVNFAVNTQLLFRLPWPSLTPPPLYINYIWIYNNYIWNITWIFPHTREFGGTFFFPLGIYLSNFEPREWAYFVIEIQEALWENANGRTWAEWPNNSISCLTGNLFPFYWRAASPSWTTLWLWLAHGHCHLS